jgi:RNA polymerase sigma factor (TIGR02999 family)
MEEYQVTRILNAVEQGEASAEDILPHVYEELRRLAASKLAQEAPGHTLQSTAIVHEAYLRLTGGENSRHWNGRRHFFAAAAEAMKRILIDHARKKKRLKRGGGAIRVDLSEVTLATELPCDQLLALDEAMELLAAVDPQSVELIKLRFFAGLKHQQAAELLGLTRRQADERWAFARAWLFQEISRSEGLEHTPKASAKMPS